MIDTKYLARVSTPESLCALLVKVPRWNGQSLLPWSVAQHSLVAAWLVPEKDPICQLDTLYHDCEEAFVGDTPYIWKTEEQAKTGDDVRDYLFNNVLKMPQMDASRRKAVKPWDQTMALAEANLLLAPVQRLEVLEESGKDFPSPRHPAYDHILRVATWSPSEVVDAMMTMTSQLFEDRRVQALKGRL